MQKKPVFILASRSPWRKKLLKKHGFECRIHVSDFEEMKSHSRPNFLVLHNAKGKALEVLSQMKKGGSKLPRGALIIGVDTVGVLGKRILGKPRHRADASAMLRSLRGKRHRVITGLCLCNVETGELRCSTETTWITFRKFSSAELRRYLDSGQWKGKAGSYAIQGRAKGFVSKIEGDITNVVGLPIEKLRKLIIL